MDSVIKSNPADSNVIGPGSSDVIGVDAASEASGRHEALGSQLGVSAGKSSGSQLGHHPHSDISAAKVDERSAKSAGATGGDGRGTSDASSEASDVINAATGQPATEKKFNGVPSAKRQMKAFGTRESFGQGG